VGRVHLSFLEDIKYSARWLNLLHHTFKILCGVSDWEQDIIQGPFIGMLPGAEIMSSPFVVLLKQENNGTTFIVSRQSLDHIDEFLVEKKIVEKRRT